MAFSHAFFCSLSRTFPCLTSRPGQNIMGTKNSRASMPHIRMIDAHAKCSTTRNVAGFQPRRLNAMIDRYAMTIFLEIVQTECSKVCNRCIQKKRTLANNILFLKLNFLCNPLGIHCDSGRIQTCNLLIRSQMLYSVELRSLLVLSN